MTSLETTSARSRSAIGAEKPSTSALGLSSLVTPAFAIGILVWFMFPLPMAERIPDGHDSSGHLLRSAQFETSLREGQLPPRVAPDFARGYGYPVHTYYPPLFDATVTAFHLVVRKHVLAINLAISFYIVLGALGAFFLFNRLFCFRSGCIGMCAFVTCIFPTAEIFIRSGWPQYSSSIWFPWIILFIDQLRESKHLETGVGLAAVICLMNLGHPVGTMLFTPFAALVVGSLFIRQRLSRQHLVVLVLSVVVGFAASAFYWIPAWFERSYVQVQRMVELVVPESLLFTTVDLLKLVRIHWHEYTIVCTYTVLVLVTRKDAQHNNVLQPWAVLVLSLFPIIMQLPVTRPAWESISMLRNLQFPRRFMILAALPISYAASFICWKLASYRPLIFQIAPLAIALLFALQSGIHARYVPATGYDPEEFFTAPSTIRKGLTANWHDEYRPRWVERIPGEVADSFGVVATDGSKVLTVTCAGTFSRSDLVLESPNAAAVSLSRFYLPNWCVRIDGVAEKAFPVHPYGLLGFRIPAGRHHVSVALERTGIQLVADAISLIGVALLIGPLVMLLACRSVTYVSLCILRLTA